MKENDRRYIVANGTVKINASDNHLASGASLKDQNSLFNITTMDKGQTHQVELKPSTGSFTINFLEQADGSKLYIYDNHGNHIIKSLALNQGLKEINVNHQPKGVYFIKIVNGKKKNISKVVIQ